MTPFATIFEARFNALNDNDDEEPRRPKGKHSCQHYRSRKTLLTDTEADFFQFLREILPPNIHVSAKVRLGDLIDPFDNKTGQKHLDFVLCANRNLDILGAIELDDPSHEQSHRRERDAFLNQAMRAAGIPLIRVIAADDYSASALKRRLAPWLRKARE